MPDSVLVYVYWEEAGGFCSGNIKSENVQYRDGVYELFSGDEYRWLPCSLGGPVLYFKARNS